MKQAFLLSLNVKVKQVYLLNYINGNMPKCLLKLLCALFNLLFLDGV